MSSGFLVRQDRYSGVRAAIMVRTQIRRGQALSEVQSESTVGCYLACDLLLLTRGRCRRRETKASFHAGATRSGMRSLHAQYQSPIFDYHFLTFANHTKFKFTFSQQLLSKQFV